MQSVAVPDYLDTRPEIEMVSIAQNEIDSDLLHILAADGLYGSICPYRYEGRGQHGPVGQILAGVPGPGIRVFMLFL